MSYKFFLMRNAALILLSAFFLSCENPTAIGIDTGTGNVQSTYYSDTLSLETGTMLLDSAISSGQAAALIGSAIDPVFGKVSATAYLQPSLYTDETYGTLVEFPALKTSIYDSVQLRLVDRDILVFGDTLEPITLSIHRLKKPLDRNRNYNYDDQSDFEAQPLATAEINIRSFSTANRDSVIAHYITLPDELGKELMAISETDAAKTRSTFENSFAGFALVANSDSKGMYVLNVGTFSSQSTYLVLYFHNSGESTSSAYPFEFSGKRYNQIKADRAGTNLASLVQKKQTIKANFSGNTYVQASSGVVSYVKFDGLNYLKKNTIINRAILYSEADESSFNARFAKAPYLTTIELNQDKSVKRSNSNYAYVGFSSLDETSGSLGVYSDSLKYLQIDITPYIQQIIQKGKADYGLAIVPAIPTSTGSTGTFFNAAPNRIVLKNMKLELYYSN